MPPDSVDPIPYSLEQSIRASDRIFLAEIKKADSIVWNTFDGTEPAERCTTENIEVVLVQLLVKESFKGDLQAGTSFSLLLPGRPGTPGYLADLLRAELDNSFVWFLGETKNYRPANPQNPLNFPRIIGQFRQEQDGWVETKTYIHFNDISQLKELIKNPLPTPTQQNR